MRLIGRDRDLIRELAKSFDVLRSTEALNWILRPKNSSSSSSSIEERRTLKCWKVDQSGVFEYTATEQNPKTEPKNRSTLQPKDDALSLEN